jgi:hypothetical protein
VQLGHTLDDGQAQTADAAADTPDRGGARRALLLEQRSKIGRQVRASILDDVQGLRGVAVHADPYWHCSAHGATGCQDVVRQEAALGERQELADKGHAAHSLAGGPDPR